MGLPSDGLDPSLTMLDLLYSKPPFFASCRHHSNYAWATGHW
jgi:hypothetical protein